MYTWLRHLVTGTGRNLIHRRHGAYRPGFRPDLESLEVRELLSGWTPQTSGTSQNLLGVWGSGPTDLFTVGQNGTILHSNNDGVSWLPQVSITGRDLHGVWGTASTDVFAVGQAGNILHSTNDGVTWSFQASGTTQNLSAIWGSSSSDVFVVGASGTILHSTNDGVSWQAQASGTNANLSGIWGTGPGDIIAVGDNGTILHSSNDGVSWQPEVSNTAVNLAGIWGSSSTDVFTVGQGGTILHSANSTTWTPQTSGTTQDLTSVWGTGPCCAFVAGQNGTILQSTDDGTTWAAQPSGTTQGLNGLFGTAANDIIAVGQSGTILHDADNPVPQLTSLSSTSAQEGSAGFTLTVTGCNFVPTSVVQWSDGVITTNLATTFVSSTQLKATVTAAQLADEGAFTVTVVNPLPAGGTSVALPFTVADAALTPVAQTITPTEGTAFNLVVGRFLDANLSATTADYTATIDWGDLSPTSSGTLAISGSGFSVSGMHTYAEGTYNITITVTDDGGQQVIINSTANVAPVPPIASISGPTSITEGATYNLNLSATFVGTVDPDSDTIDHWTIDWGDGSPLDTLLGNPSLATHVYADGPASHTISATVFDGSGVAYNIGTVAVNVANVAPTLTISGNGTATIGMPYTLNLSANYAGDPDSDVANWTIDWGDGTSSLVSGNNTSTNHTYTSNNVYTISATAMDDDGVPYVASNTVTVIVGPTPFISGPGATTEGLGYVLTLNNGGNPSPSPTWTIDWGDGPIGSPDLQTVNGNVTSVSHTYMDGPGVATITATYGATPATNTVTVNVNAVAPNVSLSGAATVTEGVAYTLNLSAVYPGSNPDAESNLQWTINWGDSSGPQTVLGNPPTVTHLFPTDAGNYTISATFSDDDATYNASNTVAVQVLIVPPSLTLTGAGSTTEGVSYSVNLGATYSGDLDGDTITSWSVNWGDGNTTSSAGAPPASASHTYADGPANHSIVFTVFDDDGSYQTTMPVQVKNVPPTSLAITGASTVTEGVAYQLHLSAVYPGTDTDGDVITWTINWGDGNTDTVTGNNPTFAHTYADGPNKYTITATAKDDDLTYNIPITPVTVSVTNVPPAPTLSGAPTVDEGTAYTLNLAANYPVANTDVDTLTWTITWGDGIVQTVTGNTLAVVHVYANGPNDYTITATAFDDDVPVVVSGTVAVHVNPVPPTLIISGASSIVEAATYTLGLSGTYPITDADGDKILNWTITWGDGTVQTVLGNPSQVTHVYADGPASYTISATATDDLSTYNAGNTVAVNVLVVAPTLTISGASSIAEGSTYTLTLAGSYPATEPDGDTIASWTINWGDGTVQTVSGNPSSVTHVYVSGLGTFTISATASDDDMTFTAGNTVAVKVIAGAATQLVFTTQPPAHGTAGVAFTMVVAAEDAFGNLDTTFNSGVIIRFAVDPSSGAATLLGKTTGTAVSGLVSFTLTIDTAEAGYMLNASGGGVGGNSNSFTIDPAAPAKVLFTTEPPPTMAAGNLFTVTTEVLDSFGNLTTNYSGPVTVNFGTDASGGLATLGGAHSVTVSGGFSSFNLSVDKAAGGYTLTATVAQVSATSTGFDVTAASDSSTINSTLAGAAKAAAVAPPVTTITTAAGDTKTVVSSALVAVPGILLGRVIPQTASGAGGDVSTAPTEAKKVALPATVTPATPTVTVKPVTPPVTPSTPGVSATATSATGTGTTTPAAAVQPAAILQNDELWNKLNDLKEQVKPKPQFTAQVAGTVTIAVAVSLGYLLLAGRVMLWLLLALTTRPLWKEFDPLEVLSEWEKQKESRRAAGGDDESLQSMVERNA
jgi:photosystem II stability/assembly factor-like uncharacterized protein